MTPLKEALTRLATASPTAFDVHYVDEVKRIAKWALDAIEAAEIAMRGKESA